MFGELRGFSDDSILAIWNFKRIDNMTLSWFQL